MTYFKTIALFCKLLVALTVPLFSLGASAAPYFIHKDGAIIYDQATGLIWMRCNLGQKWSGSLCNGRSNREQMNNIENAIGSANNSKLYGHSDWQLPSTRQLQSLRSCVQFSSDFRNIGDGGNPVPGSCTRGYAIANGAIPITKNTDLSDVTWGSIPSGRYQYVDVWLVDLERGRFSHPTWSDSKYYIRPVRSETISSQNLATDWAPSALALASEAYDDAVRSNSSSAYQDFIRDFAGADTQKLLLQAEKGYKAAAQREEKEKMATAQREESERPAKVAQAQRKAEALSNTSVQFSRGDSTAYDVGANLIWERCPEYSSLENNGKCDLLYRTHNRSEARNVEKNGWRLPTPEELSRIRKINREIQNETNKIFPYIADSGWYRTNTNLIVNHDGKIDAGYDSNYYSVIRVRDR